MFPNALADVLQVFTIVAEFRSDVDVVLLRLGDQFGAPERCELASRDSGRERFARESDHGAAGPEYVEA